MGVDLEGTGGLSDRDEGADTLILRLSLRMSFRMTLEIIDPSPQTVKSAELLLSPRAPDSRISPLGIDLAIRTAYPWDVGTMRRTARHGDDDDDDDDDH
jgi:hypothetical protein